MKKVIFCCLVVLMGACKDKEEIVEPEVDFAPEFVGTYTTRTADATQATDHKWEVTALAKNQLQIIYSKKIHVTIYGSEQTIDQSFRLVNANLVTKDSLTINETVDVTQTSGVPLNQKVQGGGKKVVNTSGVTQINLNLKVTTTKTGVVDDNYLEFKKQ